MSDAIRSRPSPAHAAIIVRRRHAISRWTPPTRIGRSRCPRSCCGARAGSRPPARRSFSTSGRSSPKTSNTVKPWTAVITWPRTYLTSSTTNSRNSSSRDVRRRAGRSPSVLSRRNVLLDRLRMAGIVDRDIGEIAVGHQDRMHLLAAHDPGLDADGDRGLADPHQTGVHGNQIADEHGFSKVHRLDRHRHGARFRGLRGKDAAADIHLAEQPAAENIAILVGIGRHRQRAGTEIAARLDLRVRRSVNGWGVGHVGYPVKANRKMKLFETIPAGI